MDRDVNIIQLLSKGDVSEVNHLLQQKTLRTCEVLLCASRLVAHMDDYLPPEKERWNKKAGVGSTHMLSWARR